MYRCITMCKQHPTRQWHRGKGSWNETGVLGTMPSGEKKGAHMQGVLRIHRPSFVALLGFAERVCKC